MARVSETNQQGRYGNTPGAMRQPRIAMLIRRNGTWREVAFERRAFTAAAPLVASSASQEQ